jgi:hypothetical protein
MYICKWQVKNIYMQPSYAYTNTLTINSHINVVANSWNQVKVEKYESLNLLLINKFWYI